MKKFAGMRGWYYFRMGWSTYFAFIFAAVNTLTVTYYLAIEKMPSLEIIFPNFLYYVLFISLVGIPILILSGYVHYKRSNAFKSETDIIVEANPYARRNIVNTEILLELNLNLIQLVILLTKNEKISTEKIDEIITQIKKFTELKDNRSFSNNLDIEFLRKSLKQ